MFTQAAFFRPLDRVIRTDRTARHPNTKKKKRLAIAWSSTLQCVHLIFLISTSFYSNNGLALRQPWTRSVSPSVLLFLPAIGLSAGRMREQEFVRMEDLISRHVQCFDFFTRKQEEQSFARTPSELFITERAREGEK